MKQKKIRFLRNHRRWLAGAITDELDYGFCATFVQRGVAEWVEEDKPKTAKRINFRII